jgi:Universal stress protein UspA and related nucleotide-binding proteins
MFKHMLLPSDGSEASGHAAEVAIELAQRLGARISALHVMQPQNLVVPDMTGGYTYLMPDELYEQAVTTQAKRILDGISGLARKANVPCETVSITGGSPWQAIIDTARERGCDAVVMASHGRTGISAVLLGSETTKVLTHCKVPVLVTR